MLTMVKTKSKLESTFNKLSEDMYFIGVSFDGLHMFTWNANTNFSLFSFCGT